MRRDPQEQRGVARQGIRRRQLLAVVPIAASLAAITPARANDATVLELALLCDTTLRAALLAVATAYQTRTGTRVSVFPTAPGLILPQLERQVQNDILVTQRSIMDAAIAAGVVAKTSPHGAWRDPIVIAGRLGAANAAAGPMAVCDATAACDMDSLAILTALGMLATPTIGAIDTDTVAALVLNGTAGAGLMHMTDVLAHPSLQVLRVVPDSIQAPIAYTAAVTNLARRPDPARFMEFLLADQSTALLAKLGLEAVT